MAKKKRPDCRPGFQQDQQEMPIETLAEMRIDRPFKPEMPRQRPNRKSPQMSEKKLSYWEKLRDPRWQRKRLEIMRAAGFKCVACKDATKTLNVHHTYYARGKDPWDYENSSLRCLCESCHQRAQWTLEEVHRAIGMVNDPVALEFIIGFAQGFRLRDDPDAEVALDYGDENRAAGIGCAWGLDADTVLMYTHASEELSAAAVNQADLLQARKEQQENDAITQREAEEGTARHG